MNTTKEINQNAVDEVLKKWRWHVVDKRTNTVVAVYDNHSDAMLFWSFEDEAFPGRYRIVDTTKQTA